MAEPEPHPRWTDSFRLVPSTGDIYQPNRDGPLYRAGWRARADGKPRDPRRRTERDGRHEPKAETETRLSTPIGCTGGTNGRRRKTTADDHPTVSHLVALDDGSRLQRGLPCTAATSHPKEQQRWSPKKNATK